MSVSFFLSLSLSLSLSLAVFVFSLQPRDQLVSTAGAEQLVLLRLSMKLCVCAPAKALPRICQTQQLGSPV